MPVACLICAREYRALGRHLRSAHQISGAEYRATFDLPATYPLADEDLRTAQRDVMDRMRKIGLIDDAHLPLAVEAAKTAGRGTRSSEDIERQRVRAAKTGAANRTKPDNDMNPRGKTYSAARQKLNNWRKAK
jgi:hypothetical protein